MSWVRPTYGAGSRYRYKRAMYLRVLFHYRTYSPLPFALCFTVLRWLSRPLLSAYASTWSIKMARWNYYRSKCSMSKASKLKFAWKLASRNCLLIEASITSVLEQMDLVQSIENAGDVAPTTIAALLLKLQSLYVEKEELLVTISELYSIHRNTTM